MSQENVEVLARGIHALNARDRETLAGLLHEDAEWRPVLTAGGHLERTVYRGVDGMARYLDDLDAEFADTQITIEDLDAIDDARVLYRGRVVARGRASGVALDVPIWAVWEFRDGRVWRGTAFRHEAEALEAVGLRE